MLVGFCSKAKLEVSIDFKFEWLNSNLKSTQFSNKRYKIKFSNKQGRSKENQITPNVHTSNKVLTSKKVFNLLGI